MGKQSVAVASHVEGINFDTPLLPESAIETDQLSRLGFAEIATSSLRKVPSTSGFVLSIEGPWEAEKAQFSRWFRPCSTERTRSVSQ